MEGNKARPAGSRRPLNADLTQLNRLETALLGPGFAPGCLGTSFMCFNVLLLDPSPLPALADAPHDTTAESDEERDAEEDPEEYRKQDPQRGAITLGPSAAASRDDGDEGNNRHLEVGLMRGGMGLMVGC